MQANLDHRNFRVVGPDETASNRLGRPDDARFYLLRGLDLAQRSGNTERERDIRRALAEVDVTVAALG